MINNCIYVIQEREFIDKDESTFKIGRTINFKNRFNSYPKHSKKIIEISTFNYDLISVEHKIMHELKKSKDLKWMKKEYGNEYFNGNIFKIIDIITDTIENFKFKCIKAFLKELELPNIEKKYTFDDVYNLYTDKYYIEKNKFIYLLHNIFDEYSKFRSIKQKKITKKTHKNKNKYRQYINEFDNYYYHLSNNNIKTILKSNGDDMIQYNPFIHDKYLYDCALNKRINSIIKE